MPFDSTNDSWPRRFRRHAPLTAREQAVMRAILALLWLSLVGLITYACHVLPWSRAWVIVMLPGMLIGVPLTLFNIAAWRIKMYW